MMNEQDKKVPTLRFKGFANDWEQRKLSEISDPIRSYSYTRKYETNSVTGFKYIHYGDIHTGNAKEIDDPNELPSIVKGNYSKLTSGDIVVADASEDYKGIADAAILLNPGTFSVIAGLHTIAFRPNTELVFPMFVYYILQTNSFKHYGYHVGTGLKVFGISSKLFFNYLASYPSLTEQQNISKLIKLLENLITLQQRKLDLLKQLKKGLLQKMFAEKNNKQPVLRFKGFHDDWEQRKLGEVGKTQSGIGFPNKEQGGHQGIPFFKVSDMNNEGNEFEMKISNNYVTEIQIANRKWKPISEVPAVIFAKVGAALMLNRKRLVKVPFLIDNNTMAYIFSNEWDPYFGKTLFDTLNLPRYAQIGALPSFNGSDIENIKVMLPSLREQQALSHFFQNINSLITLHQRKQNHLKLLKKSLLQQMFM